MLVVGESIERNSGGGRRRSPPWNEDETITLLNTWSQTETKRRFREMGRNCPIWIDISRELEDNGFSRTWEQCKSRVHNLESHYKKIKDGTVKKTGRGELCGHILRSQTRYGQLTNVLINQCIYKNTGIKYVR